MQFGNKENKTQGEFMALLGPENGFFFSLQKIYEDTLAGNRTRASRVAGENSTTQFHH